MICHARIVSGILCITMHNITLGCGCLSDYTTDDSRLRVHYVDLQQGRCGCGERDCRGVPFAVWQAAILRYFYPECTPHSAREAEYMLVQALDVLFKCDLALEKYCNDILSANEEAAATTRGVSHVSLELQGVPDRVWFDV